MSVRGESDKAGNVWENVEVDLPDDDLMYLLLDGIKIAIESTGVGENKNNCNDTFSDEFKNITLTDRQVQDFISISANKIIAEEVARIEDSQ